ncbi:hypothetical protein [uncultured Thiodictyon sp.]|uniref:hypothetical protein n=1 Tax=uncultured Thiodictyon sp. TaxID=1846217 RepID=UPI0025E795C8|nr:hypothetical protein [uncultured Thiodictyon sp.]
MTTQETRYDLIFFGVDPHTAERAEAFNKLAHWMGVAPDQVAQTIDRQRRVLVSGLDAEAGAEAQRQLVAIGIRSNLRPCDEAPLSLTLAPIEAPSTVLACPACGHVHKIKAEQPSPVACEKCQIIFAKFEKVAQEKKERELLRQSLLSDHERRLEQDEKDRAEREAKERRRRLEAEIRKELGLPRMVKSRAGLLSSAAGIFALGLAMGAGGLLGYEQWFGSGGTSAAQPMASGANGLAAQAAGAGAFNGAVSDPGIAAQAQVAALLATTAAAEPAGGPAALLSSAAAPPINGATPDPDRPNASGAGAVPGNLSDATGFLASRLADLRTSPEWDIYVLARIDALRQQHAAPQAAALIEYLRNPELRFDRGAWLANILWNEGQSADAEGLYMRLRAAAGREPDTGGARVAALCTLARHLNQVGRPNDAEQILQQAQSIAEAMTGPADKVAADTEIAALLTDLGRPQDARKYFNSATSGLARVQLQADRLTATAALARGFAKAGFRASALNFLEAATKNVDSVKNPRVRARILAVIAQTSAQLGDIQTAKGTAARIVGPLDQDRTLYRIVGNQIVSNRLTDAMDAAAGLQTPDYQALAGGLLGLHQLREPTYRPLAPQSTAKARATANALTDPAEKSAVIAELGRLAVRGGDAAAADDHFAQAHELAEALQLATERDRALAILATNEALALRLADARQELPKIADEQLRLALTSDLSGLDTLVGAADH